MVAIAVVRLMGVVLVREAMERIGECLVAQRVERVAPEKLVRQAVVVVVLPGVSDAVQREGRHHRCDEGRPEEPLEKPPTIRVDAVEFVVLVAGCHGFCHPSGGADVGAGL